MAQVIVKEQAVKNQNAGHCARVSDVIKSGALGRVTRRGRLRPPSLDVTSDTLQFGLDPFDRVSPEHQPEGWLGQKNRVHDHTCGGHWIAALLAVALLGDGTCASHSRCVLIDHAPGPTH
jgi:hypothetical protein